MSKGRFSKRIGYTFSDQGLLEQALTHRSAGSPHNERLEFLGDAILNFVVAEVLFQRFVEAREGELTRFRASLVKGATLSALARELDLGSQLRLGSGELKSGNDEIQNGVTEKLQTLIVGTASAAVGKGLLEQALIRELIPNPLQEAGCRHECPYRLLAWCLKSTRREMLWMIGLVV